MNADLKKQWRKELRRLGIICVLVCIAVFMFGVHTEKKARPSKVEYGYSIDGEYVKTDTGYIGGNRELREKAENLKLGSVLFGVAGIALVVVTYVVKESPEEHKGKYSR